MTTPHKDPVLLIHGGAGAMSKSEATAEKEKAVLYALQEALKAGYSVLEKGGDALDAVEQAVLSMEDCVLFNAGKGATLTSEGGIEHDASIMDGRNRAAGSLSSSKRIRNPVSAARIIMERTPYIHLTGDGLELFARDQDIPMEAQWYFFTPERLASLTRVKAAQQTKQEISEKDRHGTVGAVAYDCRGNLAAATSTGGHTNKYPGRVGDTGMIGAGTFADNRTIAFSGTGHGESFIRTNAGHRVSDLVELKGIPLEEAVRQVLDEIASYGGTGGIIALDAKGHDAICFNTPGMYRGIARKGAYHVGIFAGDLDSVVMRFRIY